MVNITICTVSHLYCTVQSGTSIVHLLMPTRSTGSCTTTEVHGSTHPTISAVGRMKRAMPPNGMRIWVGGHPPHDFRCFGGKGWVGGRGWGRGDHGKKFSPTQRMNVCGEQRKRRSFCRTENGLKRRVKSREKRSALLIRQFSCGYKSKSSGNESRTQAIDYPWTGF